MTKRLLWLIGTHCLFCACALGAVWYVDMDNASGTADGQSWTTAFTAIQPAIDAASGAGGGEVWVAEGVYSSIVMTENVYMYGGFAGTETQRSQRDWQAQPTILDGQEQDLCVMGAGHWTLDGFIIRNGRPGMISEDGSPTVANCTFSGNAGPNGAMVLRFSSPVLTNCTFMDNTASTS